jgi:hypothetical protein
MPVKQVAERTEALNAKTGEVTSAEKWMDTLRDQEREISDVDGQIKALSENLKELKASREGLIGKLRQAIRETEPTVLPLFDLSGAFADVVASPGDEDPSLGAIDLLQERGEEDAPPDNG